MRVTKTIKDYVTRMVKEIYSEPTEEEKVLKTLEEELDVVVDKINKEVKPIIEKRLEEFNIAHNLDKETGGLKFRNEYICFYNAYDLTYYSEIGRTARRARESREKKINEAIENIIITLELGGNKTDLDRMLNELKENK